MATDERGDEVQEKPPREADGDRKNARDTAADDQDGDNAADADGTDDGDREPDRPPLYKRPIFWIVVAIVAAVLIVGSVLYWLHSRKFQSTDDAFIDTHLVRIAAQTSGKLQQVARVDNRHIPAGSLLAVIQPDGPEAQRSEALAGIAEADAGIMEAQARVAQAEAAYRAALANARVPRAEAQRASADYARYRELQRIDPLAAAPTQIGQARAQAQSAEAQAAAARQQAQTARADIVAARRQVEAARAQRKSAEARLAQSDVSLSYLRIRAPIAGQVVNRSVNVGSYVSPGDQLMAIVPEDLWITANFKETQLAQIRPGQPVSIEIDAYPDHEFAGYVDSIQRGAGQAFQLLPPQNATGNFVKVVQRVPVRIRFRGSDWRHYALGPGMSVVPTVRVRE